MREAPCFEVATDAESILDVLSAAGRRGDLVRVESSKGSYYLLRHPAYIKHVIQDHQRNYRKLTRPYDITSRFFGRGLVNAEDEGWLSRKRILQPAFHPHALGDYIAQMEHTVGELLLRLEAYVRAGQLVEIKTEVHRATAALVTRLLFDEDLSELALAWNQLVDEALASDTTQMSAEAEQTLRESDELVYAKIARARGGGQCGPLLARFLAAESSVELSDEQLRDEVMTLLFAGVDSTASKLAWVLLSLARHPALCDELRTELDEVLDEGPFDVARLKQLTLLRMVLHESMRLYPPAWSISRRSLEADCIDGYPIPAGSDVIVSQWVTHRAPEYWDDPLAFMPSRFTPQRVAERPRYAYFPFLGGTHRCIGEHLSMLEGSLFLRHILRHYSFSPSPLLLDRPRARAMLQPRYGLWLSIQRLEGAASAAHV